MNEVLSDDQLAEISASGGSGNIILAVRLLIFLWRLRQLKDGNEGG